MDSTIVFKALGEAGAYAALAFSAVGSAIGTGIAGSSAVGAWKKCYAQNKPAPFLLLAYAGAPLSQTIYGLVLLIMMKMKISESPDRWPLFLIVGLLGGIAMGVSAWYQGRAGAGACDSFAETGKGFTNNISVLGIVETIALFALVSAILIIYF